MNTYKLLPLLLVLSGTATAEYTAANWISEVQSDDAKTTYQAEGYVFGLLEATRVVAASKPDVLKFPFCLPKDSSPESLTKGIKGALLRDGRQSTLNQPAPIAIILAARNEYPCVGEAQ